MVYQISRLQVAYGINRGRITQSKWPVSYWTIQGSPYAVRGFIVRFLLRRNISYLYVLDILMVNLRQTACFFVVVEK